MPSMWAVMWTKNNGTHYADVETAEEAGHLVGALELDGWSVTSWPTQRPGKTVASQMSDGLDRSKASPSAVEIRPLMPERWLTVGEVAGVFNVDRKTVTRWADAGRLPFVRTPGGHRRFSSRQVALKLGYENG